MDVVLEKVYRECVKRDFDELIREYPFSQLTFLPTIHFEPAIVRTVAVHKDLVEEVRGKKEDFMGMYSKELYIIIPRDYKQTGCKVYGAPWLDFEKIKAEDIHFFLDKENGASTASRGFHMCVGVPASFPRMKNVLLENVRTADNMLVAYKNAMINDSDTIELKAYSHGDKGEEEFITDKRRFIQ